MKKLLESILAVLLKSVGYISSLLSTRKRLLLGGLVGYILRKSSSKRYAITLDNLSLAWPEKDSLWQKNTAKNSYTNIGIVLAEILAFEHLSNEQLTELIEFANINILTNANKCQKGMILLSGHYGNWELLAYSAGFLSEIPINIVVASQHNQFANEYINLFRTRHNNKIVPTANAARNIIKILKNNGVIAMLADQSADTSKDIFIDFFNRPASTFETPAALALKFNIPLIIGFAVRQSNGKYTVTLEEILYDDLTYTKEGIEILTKRHVAILERTVRLHPEQWSWQHKRWKK